MKKVVFLSWHYYNSKRKAGFHFLANALKNRKFKVVFITSVISLLTYLRKENKIYEREFNKNVLMPLTFDGVKSIINFSLFQPPISRPSVSLEFLAKIFFRLNKASITELCEADYVIFESLASIRFFQKIKAINPAAKLIYRMSDDMEAMNVSRITVEYERSIINQFDLVSVPTQTMYENFLKLSPENVKLHFHGIDKEMYDKSKDSPYSEEINHIFVGNSYLDQDFIEVASALYSNHKFHIVGGFEPAIKRSNVIYYGYMPFESTIPYVKFATTGLQIMTNGNGIAETLGDSLKVLQYSYCKLPVIAPSAIPAQHRNNFFYYEYNDESSIRSCIDCALKADRSTFVENAKSWDELAIELMNN